MKQLLLLLAFVFCIPAAQAQNVEGQIIASQYGTWKVQGYSPNTYSWPGGSCNGAGPNGQFAFAVGTPVRIVDGSPALSETVTPSALTNTNQTCAISISAVNAHNLPFYLTSATGGLQEAINQNLTTPATNTIILSNEWYQLITAAGANAAAVIAAVQGSTVLGLQDVTQVPNTFYAWNGSRYAQVGTGGGSVCPAGVCNSNGTGYGLSYQVGTAPNALVQLNASSQLPAVSAALLTNYPTFNQNTTGTAANLSGTPALPNGTTCTTQSPGDNTGKCASDAFVQAAISSSGGGSVTTLTWANTASTPVFSCAVSNPTTTPQVTCTLSTAAANSILGNFTGSSAAPTYSATPAFNGSLITNLNASAATSGTLPTAQLPTVPVTKGGTGLTAIAANQTPVGGGTNTYAPVTLPNCTGPGQALTWNTTTMSYGCNAVTVTICSGNTPISGMVPTVNWQQVGTVACSDAAVGDRVLLTSRSNIYTVGGFQPSINGVLSLSAVVTAGTITINASNNTAINQTIGAGETVDYQITR